MGKFNQILKENRYVQSVQKDIVLSFYIKKNTKKKSAYAFLTKENVPTFHISRQYGLDIPLSSSMNQSHLLYDSRVSLKAIPATV